ncbi:MAG: hypothetical protein OEV20_07585, partial [Actinomycetota bacterium]|nr:hypothetical protein [Actinomycetota bacterium]
FLFGVAATAALYFTPHTELCFDPMRGVLEELHVRGGWRGRRVLERCELPTSGFDHVRIEERWRSAHETDPEEDSTWILFLEGPVQWMGADGDVHLRGDVVRVGELGSRFAARRRAAEIARSLGLRVLDNSVSD